MAKLHVNFVISEDKASRIFAMIFQRFLDCGELSVTISRKPIPRADVYHYHRPQMEHDLGRRSVVTVHHDLDDPDPFVRFSGFERQYRQADRIIA